MIKTGYSFRHAVGHLPDVVERLKEIGWTRMPIADRNSTFAFTQWSKLATNPVFGVELGVAPTLTEKKQTLDWWTFLAIGSLRPLHELVYQATANFGREPSLTYEQALNAEGVFKISGPAVLLQHVRPAENFYVGLAPALPRATYRSAQERGLPFVASSVNVYPRKTDREFYRILLHRHAYVQTYAQHILSDEEYRIACGGADDVDLALRNRDDILSSCTAKMKRGTLLIPEKKETLQQLCERGAKELNIDLTDVIYAERVNRELALIAEKEFEDYFYIISDMVNWARERMIVGPARGSSCGSLVCYLLGITSIDPIPYGLLFERFIDTTRSDLPDIDIDFSDRRRELVFEYVEKKYGRARVARLGTVGMYMPRSALNAAGAALRIPKWKVDKVTDSIIQRSSGDARAMLQLEDTLQETEAGRALMLDEPELAIASRMEGHPNNASKHAAGVLLTNEPMAEYVAVDARTKAAMCVKKDAEALNLLKIDALGLTQLSIFERALELIGVPAKSGWLEKLPLNDQAAFDVLNRGHFSGIFQFMGGSLQSLVKEVTINDLEDIIAITALARPGPMATGGATSWAHRKNGHEGITTLHPMLTDLTRDTMGITIYQEQVMNIVRTMGAMSWEDTSAIRKAMSGRLGDEFFARYWIKFRDGASAQGIDEETAKAVWDQINTFGSWAFNRSHAVAYGIVSYWCCWLKAHHPLEFAAATLDAESDPKRQIDMLRELRTEGVTYTPVDPDHSTDRWQVDGNRLIGPLTNIKGFGPASVQEILETRRNGGMLKPAMLAKLQAAKTDIDSLEPIADKVRALYPDLQRDAGIFTIPTPAERVTVDDHGNSTVVIIGVPRRIAPRDENDSAKVQNRNGRRLSGPTMSLNIFMNDDSGEILCKVDRFLYDKIGREIVNNGRSGKSIYAIKGNVPDYFRMVWVHQVKYLGEMDD